MIQFIQNRDWFLLNLSNDAVEIAESKDCEMKQEVADLPVLRIFVTSKKTDTIY
jgi:hypothetical protein